MCAGRIFCSAFVFASNLYFAHIYLCICFSSSLSLPLHSKMQLLYFELCAMRPGCNMQRGKFYPQLSYLIKVNTPRAVMQETKKAFRKLPNLEQALTALSNLKGVGITMASALLAAAAPDSAPFMADECKCLFRLLLLRNR